MVCMENVTTVKKEDRIFIQDIAKLTPEKQALVKGIVIGLQLEDKGNAGLRNRGQETQGKADVAAV